MKLVKFGFLVLLMSMMMISCSDDSSTDPDGDDKEVEEPTGKITLVTSIDGNEEESRVIESKGNVTTPINY